jgi:hypothetical protein
MAVECGTPNVEQGRAKQGIAARFALVMNGRIPYFNLLRFPCSPFCGFA